MSLWGEERGFASVDRNGVLRWNDSGEEVALFGVNYYAPFTVDFAGIARKGLDHKAVMRQDMAHFRRLGLDCLRIHCFDRQFSREDGSFVENIHVELLDDLIALCGEVGFHIVLTPIAWWGGKTWVGDSAGFSDVYPMRQMTSDHQAWAIQAKFLKAFAEHRNRRTGKRYAEDPTIVAFECINEPLYPNDFPDSEVTAYINTLADALRAGGARQPIFFNSWQQRNSAAGKARIDGITGSYYPTGLVAGHALTEPVLGTIHASTLSPDAAVAAKAKMIYEFDAADTPGAYMYPALAKLFRAEGVQIANQFQYDPMVLAGENGNWQTHHLNLVYTPQKALSFAIAAEAFRRLPRGGRYTPAAEAIRFPPFLVSVAGNLSEYVTATHYYYTHTPQTPPPDPAHLEHVWGYGDSAIIRWPGTGAYFLDRIGKGIWRLQIYPDLFVHTDPYSGGNDSKIAVLPTRHPLTLNLPDLGETYTVWPLPAADTPVRASNGTCTLESGDYWVTAQPTRPSIPDDPLPPYIAPDKRDDTPRLMASVPAQNRDTIPIPVTIDAVFAPRIEASLTSCDTPSFSRITHETLTLQPGINRIQPHDRTADRAFLSFAIKEPGQAPLALFPTAQTRDVAWFPAVPFRSRWRTLDLDRLSTLSDGLTCRPVKEGGALTLTWNGESGRRPICAGVRIPCTFTDDTPYDAPPVIRMTIVNPTPREARVEVGFAEERGGLGCDLYLPPGTNSVILSPGNLQPRWNLKSRDAFRWTKVNSLSLLTGAWLWKNQAIGEQRITLTAFDMAPAQAGLAVALCHTAADWNFLDPRPLCQAWYPASRSCQVFDDRGRPAFHIETDGFVGKNRPDSISWKVRCDGERLAAQFPETRTDTAIILHARACDPETTQLEVVLVNRDNTPWGTVIPLTTEWQDIRIPLDRLTFFRHWKMIGNPGLPADLKNTIRFQFCYGRWLYPETADRQHSLEISAIHLEGEPGPAPLPRKATP